MAEECCEVSKIVTTFLLNTCRLPPRLSHHDVHAATLCAQIAGLNPANDETADLIPLTTGSVAEFYIEPMLPLNFVGDVDVMYHLNTLLAIPLGYPPPTQLPAEFHNSVMVFVIINSHLPGYVFLRLRYLLTRSFDHGNYNYAECVEGQYLPNAVYKADNVVIHGPAAFINSHTSYLSVDIVNCIHFLSWPPQAADWLTRHRNYGWPDSATLDRVVGNGCDVVPVAHRKYRPYKLLIGKFQWRLSFSRAEIVLINSWMPVQQIVYHMLRYFIKTERLTDCADNPGAATLSNYHIKTLMLWACELKSRSWWTENLNLVRICVELFHTLSVWLTDTRCPHYFINNGNLLDNSFDVKNVASILMSIDEEYLSTWLLKNYIGQCAQLCPAYILRLFDNVSSSMKLQNAVSEIVRSRLNTSLVDLWRSFSISEYIITLSLPKYSFTARSYVFWMNELTKIDKRLSVYLSAVALLHVACKIIRNGLTEKLMDILSTILGRNFSHSCSDFSVRKTELNTPELVEFLQKFAVEHLATYRQLLARNFGSVVAIVTTDFEAMYAYKRGDYQRCLQLSTQNVHALLYAARTHDVLTYPEFIQLFDDDIVSLTALMLIINPGCITDVNRCVSITQLTLSLYLMTQSQLKLHHSETSLAQALRYIEVAQTRHLRDTLDHLTLKLIERKVCMYLVLKFTAS